MKKQIIFLLIFILTISVRNSFSKILVMGCLSYTYQNGEWNQYLDDIKNIDGKNVEVIEYSDTIGDNVDQCMNVRSKIEASYASGVTSKDLLEGVVLIGDFPVPILYTQDSIHLYSFTNMPNDYYYMDIWDTTNKRAYSNNGAGIFSIDTNIINGDTSKVFVGNADYEGVYNFSAGDGKLDIWVSRIDPANLPQLRMGSVTDGIVDTGVFEDDFITDYLQRLHARMAMPALVPSRGFAMGGPSDYNPLDSVMGRSMDSLKLPWFVEFTDGQNSGYNWMSQLQAGPGGNINYGAFNGVRNPTNERNRQYCRYTQLADARSYSPYNNRLYTNLDTNGWEWAGIYNHAAPTDFSSNCVGGGLLPPQEVTLNGGFGKGALAPFWGTAFHNPTGGYIDNSGYDNGFYHYRNDTIVPDPYFTGYWKGKSASWRWKIQPGQVGTNGACDVYLGYLQNATNNNAQNVMITILEASPLADGTPGGDENYWDTITVHQNAHTVSALPMNVSENQTMPYWEHLNINPAKGPIPIKANDWIIVQIDENSYFHDTAYYDTTSRDTVKKKYETPTSGNVIADAVMFRSTNYPTIPDEIINCNTQPYIPDDAQINQPYGIFAATGFYTSDDVGRGFEDMQDEDTINHLALSKVPFFLSACCETNWFTKTNCIGNLFALGHNGLISMGCATIDYMLNNNDSSFTTTLNKGKDFGQAFLAQAQSEFNSIIYTLLGAGSLKAQPYVQFGTTGYYFQTFSAGTSITQNSPILLDSVTITANGGNVSVLSTTTAGAPLGTHAEVVIQPETHIYPPSAGNTVDIKAVTN